VKLKTESLNLNLLQEQCAELEKEKNIMIIEVEALHTDFNGRLALLDSEINTVSYSKSSFRIIDCVLIIVPRSI
jgi:hypothetical protein